MIYDMGQEPPPLSPEMRPEAPLPVASLAYDNPYHRAGRPGILTAVGVISIILACLSGLASLWTGVMTTGLLMASQTPMPMVSVPAPPPVAGGSQTIVSGGMIVVPENDGLAQAQREVVIRTIVRQQPMTPQRMRQLDELLMQAGKLIFPVAADSADQKLIEANINERGMLPSASGGMGPYYLIVGTGRVEVYDDHAIFRPDGSADYLSVSVPEAPTTQGVQVQSATQNFNVSGSGFTTVTTTSGGRTTTVTTTTGGAMPFMMPKISPVAAAASIGEAVVSLLLAILLFVAGILVLNDSRHGRKMHWIWLSLKIPLILTAAVANWYVWTSWTSGFMPPGAGGPQAISGMMAAWMVVGACVALAYPVSLIFVLRSRSVRDYYDPNRATPGTIGNM